MLKKCDLTRLSQDGAHVAPGVRAQDVEAWVPPAPRPALLRSLTPEPWMGAPLISLPQFPPPLSHQHGGFREIQRPLGFKKASL